LFDKEVREEAETRVKAIITSNLGTAANPSRVARITWHLTKRLSEDSQLVEQFASEQPFSGSVGGNGAGTQWPQNSVAVRNSWLRSALTIASLP
jgi:hypothetical protein